MQSILLISSITASYLTKFPYSRISPTPHRHQYDWKLEEAQKNIKYFSIDRVFRNEATHLAEFHQIEGVVADYNLTLGDLIGVLNVFCKNGWDPSVCLSKVAVYYRASAQIFRAAFIVRIIT